MSKERITLGSMYKHPTLNEPGMVVWVGKYRDAITGDMEPACKILWLHGETDTYFNSSIYAEIEHMGRFKKVQQVARKMGVDERYTLNGERNNPELRLSVWSLKDGEGSADTPTVRLVKAWKLRCGATGGRILVQHGVES